ncbi:MAG TPA: methyltransferase domain-containing protein, partial [Gaiellaceae bacterium]|nr:methyltransferase domain-containing protein [Gaiellaceae bacterium]
TEPVGRVFGFDRGLPVDRWYIERFLADQAADIRGRVLEVAERTYTDRFGTAVTRSDVLHLQEGHGATIVGNLATGEGIPVEAFEAIVLTQTLQFVYEVRDAIRVLHRALVPGGVLLLTVPGISQLSRHDVDRWGEFWRFTRQSLERLLVEAFASGSVDVHSHGNVKATVALLHGLASEDLAPGDLEAADADYELIITARAVKA